MNFYYMLQGIHFEWDIQKASDNLHKHDISFEKAYEAFFDPFAMAAKLEEHNGEFRETIFGLTADWKLLYVVYTMRGDDVFRIISARRTTKSERRFYENQ